MKQGTISILFGCHSIIHSILVLISWKKLYKRWPKFWQICCIFLHDIGHYGLNYLDNYTEKQRHWVLGAKIAKKLFGIDGYLFIAGHDENNNYPKSDLYAPDKYSWYIAPKIWLYLNCIFEPKTRMGYTRWEAVEKFKAQVKINIESGKFESTHNLYLRRCQFKGK